MRCPWLLPARPGVLPAPQTCLLPTHLPFRISPGAGLRVTRYFPLSPEIITFILEGSLVVFRLLAWRLLPFQRRQPSHCARRRRKSSLGSYSRSLQGIFLCLQVLSLPATSSSRAVTPRGVFGFSSCSGSRFPGGTRHPCGKAGSALH